MEDATAELKDKMAWQKDTLARCSHTVGKLAVAGIQAGERQDQVTIFAIKQKSEKPRNFFEAYRALQKTATDDKTMAGVTNNGRMIILTMMIKILIQLFKIQLFKINYNLF